MAGWIERAARWLAMGTAASALALTVRHLNDLRWIDYVAGVWLGLAQQAASGIWYPPWDGSMGTCYGGVRYMPVFFALQALLGYGTGDYLWTAKLLTFLATVAMLGIVFVSIRQTVGAIRAATLAACLLSLDAVLICLFSIRCDTLATVFGLAAAALVAMETTTSRPWVWIAAGMFCALAVMTKFTALAPAAAIVCTLNWRRPRELAYFVGSMAGFCVFIFAAAWIVSDGRIVDNLTRLGASDTTLESLAWAPLRMAINLICSGGAAIVVPIALFLATRNMVRRDANVWDWYCWFAFGSTLLILSSPGAVINHLVELAAVSFIVVAISFDTPELRIPGPWRSLQPRLEWIIVATALTGLYFHGSYWSNYNPLRKQPLADCYSADPSRIARKAYAPIVDRLAGERLLFCDDATVPVVLGKEPIMVDAYQFGAMARSGIGSDRALCERIRKREFPVVLLNGRLEEEVRPSWYPMLLGKPMVAALRETYRFEGTFGRHYLYVPIDSVATKADSPTRRR